MEENLAAAFVASSTVHVGVGGDAESILNTVGRIEEPSLGQQVAALGELKNSLVGDDEAKRTALNLLVVEDVLTFLDVVAARGINDCHLQSALLHGVGLFAILSSPPVVPGLQAHLAPNGSRIVQHIVRALEWGESSGPFSSSVKSSSRGSSAGIERLTAISLRALCACVAPLTTVTCSSCSSGDVGVGAACAAFAASAASKEKFKMVTALVKASGLILENIVAATSPTPTTSTTSRGRRTCPSSWRWSLNLKSLGVEALAAMTRVEELARKLVPGAVSTGAALLIPILARKPDGTVGTVAAGPVEASMANSAFPVLELLVNLSCADPHAIYNWLASCSPDDGSPGGALKGLEIALNSRVEKVRILAGLVLVSCFKSSKMRLGTTSSPRPSSHQSTESPALDEVIAHRVLPLLVRTLSSWSTLPSTINGQGGGGGGSRVRRTGGFHRSTSNNTSGSAAASFATVCGGFAAAVTAALTATTELGSLRRQREAVAYGTVDSLVVFLKRARTEAAAAGPESMFSLSASTSTATADNNAPSGAPSSAAATTAAAAAAAAAAAVEESSRSMDSRLIRTATETGLKALAALCARCEPARERTVALGFHSAVGYWLATSPRENGKGSNLPLDPSSSRSRRCDGVGGCQRRSSLSSSSSSSGGSSSAAVRLAALLLVRNLGRSSVACSALVGVGVHERLLGLVTLGGGCGGHEETTESTVAGGKGEAVVSGAEEDGAEEGTGTNGGIKTGATGVAQREALASACLANMALEHGAVKEAVVGSEACLRGICNSSLDLSVDRKNARMASIAVLKSTCFLASLHVRVKVAYFLGGVNGMLGLIQGPRDEAVLQGLYTLRNILNGVPLWALCWGELGTTPTPDNLAGERQRDRDAGLTATGSTAAAGAGEAPAATTTTAAAAATRTAEQQQEGGGGPAGIGGPGGHPALPPASQGSGSSSPDWRRHSATPAGDGGRQQRRNWQGWRGHWAGGGVGYRGNNNNVARNLWGELDASPASFSSFRGRGDGGGRGGRGRGWGRGRGRGRGDGFGGRSGSLFDNRRPDPMDVASKNTNGGGGGGGSGGEGGVLVTTGPGGWREDTTGPAFLWLMEAVLGTLGRGGDGDQDGGDCDETSCAALRLLHVLSTADDSQRAALRTPRVLHAALRFLTPTSATCSSSTTNGDNAEQPPESSSSADSPVAGSLHDPETTTAATTAPARAAANVTARLLLAELLPQRSGDNIDGNINAAFAVLAASGVAAGGGACGLSGWTGGAGGQRRARAAVAGAWRSGLEFDRAAA